MAADHGTLPTPQRSSARRGADTNQEQRADWHRHRQIRQIRSLPDRSPISHADATVPSTRAIPASDRTRKNAEAVAERQEVVHCESADGQCHQPEERFTFKIETFDERNSRPTSWPTSRTLLRKRKPTRRLSGRRSGLRRLHVPVSNREHGHRLRCVGVGRTR